MLILGIDPGTATTGYGLIKIKNPSKLKSDLKTKNNLESLGGNLKGCIDIVDYGCLVTSSEATDGERLNTLFLSLGVLLEKHSPDLLAIERLFFFSNAKTVISVGQSRGVVILAAAQKGISVYEYAPSQIKSELVGYGRAKKKEVQKRVGEILGVDKLTIKKDKKFIDGHHIDDAVDALAVALLHFSKEMGFSLKPEVLVVDKKPVTGKKLKDKKSKKKVPKKRSL